MAATPRFVHLLLAVWDLRLHLLLGGSQLSAGLLTAQLWLDWLNDEEELARTAVNQEHDWTVIELFDRAVNGYWSVDLWLEYVSFIVEVVGRVEGSQKVQEAFERGSVAAGVHCTSGWLLWCAYRDFKLNLLWSYFVVGNFEFKHLQFKRCASQGERTLNTD